MKSRLADATGPLSRSAHDLEVDLDGPCLSNEIDGMSQVLERARLGAVLTLSHAAVKLPGIVPFRQRPPALAPHVAVDFVADLVAHAGIITTGRL